MRRVALTIVSLLLATPVAAETLVLDVENAAARIDPQSGQPIVVITLSTASQVAFSEFTKVRIGERTKLRFGQRVLTEPFIREQISGGTIMISGSMTTAAAQELAVQITSASGQLFVEGSDR